MFDEIVVDPESERRLREVDFRAEIKEGFGDLDPLVPSRMTPGKKIVRKTHECGTCVFQGPDKLCNVHKVHGMAHKPQVCMDFPWRFVESPGGVYVGLSFACTAVLENAGQPVGEQRAELDAHYPAAQSKRDAMRAVRLTHRHCISWDAYMQTEAVLRRLLAQQGQPFGLRLVAQSIFLDLLDLFVRHARGDAPGQDFRRAPGEDGMFPADSGDVKDADVVALLVKKHFERSEGAELFRLAAKLRPSPTLHRVFIGLMTAFRENLKAAAITPSRAKMVARILRHYFSSAAKFGKLTLMDVEKPFGYDDLARLDFDPTRRPELARPLVRYFDHALFRKDLLLADNVWLGHRLHVMGYALVRWYAAGVAAQRGLAAVDTPCLDEAIRQVERNYAFHTRFGRLFEEVPTLGMVIDALVKKPVFAASIAGPAV